MFPRNRTDFESRCPLRGRVIPRGHRLPIRTTLRPNHQRLRPRLGASRRSFQILSPRREGAPLRTRLSITLLVARCSKAKTAQLAPAAFRLPRGVISITPAGHSQGRPCDLSAGAKSGRRPRELRKADRRTPECARRSRNRNRSLSCEASGRTPAPRPFHQWCVNVRAGNTPNLRWHCREKRTEWTTPASAAG